MDGDNRAQMSFRLATRGLDLKTMSQPARLLIIYLH
jgi:hypothetical protein